MHSPEMAMIPVRTLLLLLLLAPFLCAHAAPVSIRYDLAGGMIILTGSGTVLANIRGTALGVPYSLTRTGVVSGATSWNMEGPLDLAIGDDGLAPVLSDVDTDLILHRRAGTILVGFPLIQIGAFDAFSIDLSFRSAFSGTSIINSGDFGIDAAGVGGVLSYEAPTAIELRLSNRNGPRLSGYFPAYFAARNEEHGGSTAAINPMQGTSAFEGGALESISFEDCHYEAGGACLLSYRVTYDFTGLVTSISSASPASGWSSLSLPVPQPVPLPATFWLLASALGGLGLWRARGAP